MGHYDEEREEANATAQTRIETSRLGGGRTRATGSAARSQSRVDTVGDQLLNKQKHAESLASRIHRVCDELTGPTPVAVGERMGEDRPTGSLWRLEAANESLNRAMHELEEAIDRLEQIGIA